MQGKDLLTKISSGFLMLGLVLLPQLSFAGPAFYRWHDHPAWGVHAHVLPAGYTAVLVGRNRYYYYDGLYYTQAQGDYVLVSPPVGAYVSVIPVDFHAVAVRGRTYYTDNGIYYVRSRHHGYKVVVAPRR